MANHPLCHLPHGAKGLGQLSLGLKGVAPQQPAQPRKTIGKFVIGEICQSPAVLLCEVCLFLKQLPTPPEAPYPAMRLQPHGIQPFGKLL
jgi:hypothetical protein